MEPQRELANLQSRLALQLAIVEQLLRILAHADAELPHARAAEQFAESGRQRPRQMLDWHEDAACARAELEQRDRVLPAAGDKIGPPLDVDANRWFREQRAHAALD